MNLDRDADERRNAGCRGRADFGVKSLSLGFELAEPVDEQKLGSSRKGARDAMGGVGERRRIDAAGLRLGPKVLQDRNASRRFRRREKRRRGNRRLAPASADLYHAADAMAAPLERGGEIRDDPVCRVIVVEDHRRQALCFRCAFWDSVRSRPPPPDVKRDRAVALLLPLQMSPVSRRRCGMSMAASGSVHSTMRRSPSFNPRRALPVRRAGSGHLRPRRSRAVQFDWAGIRRQVSCAPAGKQHHGAR